jgi:hypothetical protein
MEDAMRHSKRLLQLAVAAACAASPLAMAQSPAAPSDLVVITITPLGTEKQRRESAFRAIDANGDGEVNMAEAGVNTRLLQAFNQLDRNGNKLIDRQEFARVHVDDGSKSAQASRGESSSAASGATNVVVPSGPLPSRSIEERTLGAYPGESGPPNTRGQSTR